MSYSTKTIWGRHCTEEEINILTAKSNELTASGLTDGLRDLEILAVVNDPLNDWPSVTRNWISEEAATSWITYINTFTPPPILAEVISK